MQLRWWTPSSPPAGKSRLRLSRATAPAGTLGLTERELDVRAWSPKASQRRIGQRLFISPKTVSVHVSHILEKLGVATRGGRCNRAPAGALTTTDT